MNDSNQPETAVVTIRSAADAIARVRQLHPRIKTGKWSAGWVPDPHGRSSLDFWTVYQMKRKRCPRVWFVETNGEVTER